MPTSWYGDLPGLDHLFNQVKVTKTVRGKEVEVEGIRMPDKYKAAEDAVLKIIEMAIKSPQLTLSLNETKMEDEVKEYMVLINNKLTTAFDYISTDPTSTEPDKKHQERMRPYHEFLMAAVKYYIYNLFAAIPAEIP